MHTLSLPKNQSKCYSRGKKKEKGKHSTTKPENSVGQATRKSSLYLGIGSPERPESKDWEKENRKKN